MNRCDKCKMLLTNYVKDGEHVCPNWRHNPDAEFRFFVFDPQGDTTYYRTTEDRDKAGQELVQNHLDEYWDEEVIHVTAGEISHVCIQTKHVERPDDDQIDESGEDTDGNYWAGDWDFIADYELVPVEQQSPPK